MAYFEGSSNDVPDEAYTIAFGQATVVREGKDLTIVTISQMVQKALVAADELARSGVDAEVVDLRTLVPLDRDAVLKSVAKTGRLLIADEDYLGFGLTGEISAIVAENLDTLALKAPVRRLAVPNVPIPYSRPLEQFVIPQVGSLIDNYRRIGQLHAAALDELGVTAHALPPQELPRDPGRSSVADWACFGGLAPWEVVSTDGRKLTGLAQRRCCSGVLLVAGTLVGAADWPLLCDAMGRPEDASALQQRTACAAELAGRRIEPERLASVLSRRLKRALSPGRDDSDIGSSVVTKAPVAQ